MQGDVAAGTTGGGEVPCVSKLDADNARNVDLMYKFSENIVGLDDKSKVW